MGPPRRPRSLSLAPDQGVLERDRRVDPDVAAPRGTPTLLPPEAAPESEEIGEHVLKLAEDVAQPGALKIEAAPPFEPGMTEAIVEPPLLAVVEHAEGFGRLLELGFGIWIVRIPVRMIFQCQLPVGAPHLVIGRLARDIQDFVEISFCAHGLRLIGRTLAAVS
jgi:hypothetical protein